MIPSEDQMAMLKDGFKTIWVWGAAITTIILVAMSAAKDISDVLHIINTMSAITRQLMPRCSTLSGVTAAAAAPLMGPGDR